MSEHTSGVDAYLWRDRYGGLHASIEPRPDVPVTRLPLPQERIWLRRMYGHLRRMIAERQGVEEPVLDNRPGVVIRVWEGPGDELRASLSRRKGATTVTVPLPFQLDQLERWHSMVVEVMDVRRIPKTAPKKRRRARVVTVATKEQYPEARASHKEIPSGLPGLGRRRWR